MAGSTNEERGRITLPRNWRVITVASATTLGLACGAVQPALGEWWKLSRDKPPAAPVAKSATTENGFAATIRRLMSDARQYAERGDLEKAVQLAERAAKISEASSQLLGPASECSPEETARFASAMRSRRDAVAKRATRPDPVQAVAVQPRSRVTTAAFTPPSASPPFPETTANHQAAEAIPKEPRPTTAIASHREVPEWTEELPPTPASEQEPTSKPIKFRRSVLARVGHSTDDSAFESRSIPEKTSPPSTAKTPIDEPREVDFADDLSLDATAEIPANALASTNSSQREVEELLADEFPKLDGQIQPVTAEKLSPVAAFDSSSNSTETSTSDKAVEPNKSLSKPATSHDALTWADEKLEPATAQPRPATAPAQSVAPAASQVEQDFPVQRVVQLRRRLETATSFNPGAAYVLPDRADSKTTIPSPAGPAASPPAGKNQTRTESHPATSNLDKWVELPHEPGREQQSPIRMREHRTLGDHERATLTRSSLIPQPPAPRKSVIGYSEPVLWHSAVETADVAITSPLDAGIGSSSSSSSPNNRAGSTSADLRGPKLSPSSEGSANRASQPLEQTARIEQAGFRSADHSLNSTNQTEISGPALSTPAGNTPRLPTLDDPASGALTGSLSAIDDPDPNAPWVVHRQTDKTRAAKHTAKPTHEVRKQSFAAVEQLASTLKLPVATTASLLGSAGLALLGLGLLLARAALRWRRV